MVRSTIRRLAEKIPEHGLAFHGTLWKNVPSIKKEGIQPIKYYSGEGGVYVAVLPPKRFMDATYAQLSEREIFERSVGSTLFAVHHSAEKVEQEIEEGHLPALIVLKGSPECAFYSGYDEDRKQSFGPDGRTVRSFGKAAFDQIPKENIAAVVRITPREYQRILSKHSAEYGGVGTAVRKLMVRKALLAVRSIIEKDREEKQNG